MSDVVIAVVVVCAAAMVSFVARCAADACGVLERLATVFWTAFLPVGMSIGAIVTREPVVVVVPGWFALSALLLSAGRPLWLVFDADRFGVERRPGSPHFSGWRQLTWALALVGGWIGLGVIGAFVLSRRRTCAGRRGRRGPPGPGNRHIAVARGIALTHGRHAACHRPA